MMVAGSARVVAMKQKRERRRRREEEVVARMVGPSGVVKWSGRWSKWLV